MHSETKRFNGNFWKLPDVCEDSCGEIPAAQPGLKGGPTRPGTYQERWDVFVSFLSAKTEVPHTGLNNRNPRVLKTGKCKTEVSAGLLPR